MATIREIAEEAGVSRTLVSRVLNQKSGVSPENRKRILEVMEKYNYVPNSLARSLVLGKTKTIGVVMDDLCNPYFFHLISGIQDAGEASGYNVLFCNGRTDTATKLKYVEYFSQGRTDGMIAYGSNQDNESLFQSMAAKTPCFVLIEGQVPEGGIHNIQLDNFSGAYKATTRLIELGYRKIVHFTGDMNYGVTLERMNGFVKAMQDHHIPITADTIVYADYHEELAYRQMNRLLDNGMRPEACFMGADKTAFGAIRSILEHDMRLPEDIAVIGFDDDEPDSRDMVFPRLTTMKQPLYEMGKAAVELLLRAIEHPDMEPEVRVFEPQFVVRDTCR